MAFDQSRSVIVMMGGTDGSAPFLSDAWEWNGTEWTRRMQDMPTPRANHAMVYDGYRSDMVVFGGTISGTPDGQTWKWGSLCDPLDFNRDGVFPDIGDLSDFVSVFAGGSCSTGTCGDIDYNNDGVFPDTTDIDSFLSRLSGGACL